MHTLRYSAVLAAALLLSGCFFTVHSGDGGEVLSSGGTRDCLEGQSCVYEINDFTFDEVFTATPLPGFEFVKWSEGVPGEGFLCAGSTNPQCTVDNTALFADPRAQAIVASDADFRIAAVFQPDSRYSVVVVDANGKVIGAPAPGNQQMYIRTDGLDHAFYIEYRKAISDFYSYQHLYYTDRSCGMDGGLPYRQLPNPPALSEEVTQGPNDAHFVPDMNALPEIKELRSFWLENNATQCLSWNDDMAVVPAIEIDLSFTPPLRTEFR